MAGRTIDDRDGHGEEPTVGGSRRSEQWEEEVALGSVGRRPPGARGDDQIRPDHTAGQRQRDEADVDGRRVRLLVEDVDAAPRDDHHGVRGLRSGNEDTGGREGGTAVDRAGDGEPVAVRPCQVESLASTSSEPRVVLEPRALVDLDRPRAFRGSTASDGSA